MSPRAAAPARSALPLVVLTLAAATLSACQLDEGGAGPGSEPATVVSVTDGDTIDVRTHGDVEEVRLVGIDAPESSSLRYGAPDCGGARATGSMARLLQPGDRVELARDPTQDDRDQYGRLLRYVERSGTDVGLEQVRRGLAEVYVFDPAAPPRRADSYRRAMGLAAAAGRGVNALCAGEFHDSIR